ncbi:MAG: universal stress protein [Haloferacaceae archaeon]
MYDHVLLPTDGSHGASRGADHALELAERFDATLHVLFVVDEGIYGATPALSSEELLFDELEEEGEQFVADVADEARERGLDVVTEIARGVPHERIATYAGDNDVDVIVMGRHGSAARGHPHIGSVTDRVIRSVETPVLPV